MEQKIAYICGPLTELAEEQKLPVKALYSRLGDVCHAVLGARAFVPHEHFDPVAHAHFTPDDVDAAERRQVCEMTSLLVIVAIAPTWGGGIEVEMAHRSGVPAIILKPSQKNISRLLRGNPAVRAVLDYDSFEDAERVLCAHLQKSLSA